MSDHLSSPLATSEDLRCYVAGTPEQTHFAGSWAQLDRRVLALAAALEALHATSGLGDAMERVGSVWMNGTVAMNLRLDDLRTVLSALRLLYTPGEPS